MSLKSRWQFRTLEENNRNEIYYRFPYAPSALVKMFERFQGVKVYFG
jgi:hypothetical protein